MTRVERDQLATLAATLGRMEDLVTQLDAYHQRQTQARTMLQEELRAVAQALTTLNATLHTLPASQDTARVAVAQALTVLETARHTLALHQQTLGRVREDQTIAWCQTVQQAIQHGTATARRTGQQLRWTLWGSAVLAGSVAGLLVLLGGSWWAASWAPTPHEPFAGLHALPRAWESPAISVPPAIPSDRPDGKEDARTPPDPAQAPDVEDTERGRTP